MNKLINNNDHMIKEIILNSRNNITYQINNSLLNAYWNVGRIIVENEQNGNIKAEYGKQIIKELSKELTKILGTGFSVSNLQYMRRFYIKYQKQQTVSVKLSWSHYCELLSISNDDERNFYEKECINSNWSVRELKRQINTSLFERLLLSEGKKNKEINDKYDNKAIGIILCKDKNDIALEYALGGLSNNIFASTYTYYIPNKEQIIAEIEKITTNNNGDNI